MFKVGDTVVLVKDGLSFGHDDEDAVPLSEHGHPSMIAGSVQKVVNVRRIGNADFIRTDLGGTDLWMVERFKLYKTKPNTTLNFFS